MTGTDDMDKWKDEDWIWFSRPNIDRKVESWTIHDDGSVTIEYGSGVTAILKYVWVPFGDGEGI